MNHRHSYMKAPRLRIANCNTLSVRKCQIQTVEVALAAGRSSQHLSVKQAESFAKKILHLVDLIKVGQVMES